MPAIKKRVTLKPSVEAEKTNGPDSNVAIKNSSVKALSRTRGLKPWKKGQSGNPKGLQKGIFSQLLDELKAVGAEEVTKGMIQQAFTLLISLKEEELAKVVKDPSKSFTVRVVARAMLSGKGVEMIEKMLDRAHGKPQQSVTADITGEGETGKKEFFDSLKEKVNTMNSEDLNVVLRDLLR